MQKLRLTRMIVSDFRGVHKIEISPDGENFTIAGANELGKTTLGDALHWLFTDRDLTGRTPGKARETSVTFPLKPRNTDGSEKHHKESSVEAFFTLNGEELALKKVFKEIHTKKRGQAKKEFTGNTNEYFINGVSKSAGEFKKILDEIASTEKFMMLMTPFYFSLGMTWQARRLVVIDVCGDISDADVIASSKDLARIPEIIGKNSINETLKEKKAAKPIINKQIDGIPIRIDENSKGQPDITGIDQKAEAKKLVDISSQINTKKESLANIDKGGASAELISSKAAVDSRISAHESTAKNLLSISVQTKTNELSSLKHTKETAELDIKSLETKEDVCQGELRAIAKSLVDLDIEYIRIESVDYEKEFTFKEDLSCEKCSQIIGVELQKDYFHVSRSAKLTEMNGEAAKLKTDQTAANSLLEGFGHQIAGHNRTVDAADISITTCSSELEELKKDKALAAQLLATEGYSTDLEERDRINIDIEKAGTGDTTGMAEKVQKEIDDLELEKIVIDARINKLTDHANLEKRNEELKTEESNLFKEFESVEEDIFLIEKFIKIKVSILDGPIQAKFPGVQFKLFSEAINGGLEECCEVMVDGVPYGGANTASQITKGQTIINTLSEHYDVELPVVIDRAESVNHLIPMSSQVIRLEVATDEELVFTKN